LFTKKIRQLENSQNSETLCTNKVVQSSSFKIIQKTIFCWCRV